MDFYFNCWWNLLLAWITNNNSVKQLLRGSLLEISKFLILFEIVWGLSMFLKNISMYWQQIFVLINPIVMNTSSDSYINIIIKSWNTIWWRANSFLFTFLCLTYCVRCIYKLSYTHVCSTHSSVTVVTVSSCHWWLFFFCSKNSIRKKWKGVVIFIRIDFLKYIVDSFKIFIF